LSNQVAHYLRDTYAIRADDLVAIKLERSEWLIISILGVLKSGGGYVPVDIEYPEERIDYIIKDSQCKAVIDEAVLNLVKERLRSYSQANPVSLSQANHLAYVMYTSGSTGLPKGVLVEHRSVVRLVKSANYVELSASDILLSTGAVSFDATTFEYWGMLLNGGRLVLCRKEVLLDTTVLGDQIAGCGVTVMWFTAGWLNQVVDEHIGLFKGLNTVLVGGDRLSASHIRALRSCYPSLKIINGYGPTENTTFSLTHLIDEVAGSIPVGKPISNSTAYILDEHQSLLPIGVVGEICVGGDGLARSYLNEPGLSAAKFIKHPYRPGERLYRTGDLGRWLEDGTIEFVGRKDSQVKIRGHRVELGEIESVLQSYAAIDSAVVIASNPSGATGNELVAYVVGQTPLDIAAIRSYLGRQLPGYMVPGYYVQLESLPLTGNGKVDRKHLPAPAGLDMGIGTVYVAPRNEIESKLVMIWQEVLGKEKIGVRDNFFELGGHSLKVNKVASSIYKEFDVKISFLVLFSNPTIEGIASEIEKIYWANNALFEIDDAERISI
jgi:amino acid adenylation domain-containing protein